MGMLTAFLSGASRGLDVLGQGMLRDVEREREDDIWKKRQAVLAEIQRENARVAREDQAAFDDARAPELLKRRQEEAKALGKTAREIELEGISDARLREARKAQRDAEATDATEREKKRIEALSPSEAKRAGMIAGATESVHAKYRDGDGKNPLLKKFADYEEATKTTLPPEVKKQLADAYLGLGKTDDGISKKAIEAVLKGYSEGAVKAEDVGKQFGAVMRSLKVDPAEQGIRDVVSQARKDGKVADLIAEMRDKNFTDAQLTVLFTADELKTTGKNTAALPRKQREPDAVESTRTPDGRTVYRFRGQDRWYASKVEAIAAMKPHTQPEDTGGFDRGY